MIILKKATIIIVAFKTHFSPRDFTVLSLSTIQQMKNEAAIWLKNRKVLNLSYMTIISRTIYASKFHSL